MQRSSGQPVPFDDLVRRHRGEILAYLVRLLSNRDDAEDACQDTFLRAYAAYRRLDVHANTRAWLYRIATRAGLNLARGRRRRSTRRTDIDPELLPAATPADSVGRDRLRRVVSAVDGLPPKQRAALMQRLFHGLSYDQIASVLGCRPTAARANVYQAIKTLRTALGDDRKGEREKGDV